MKKPGPVLYWTKTLRQSPRIWRAGGGRWEGGTHTSVKHNCVCGFFPSRAFAFSLIPNDPAYSESINLITNHPLSMWQDQVSTFYLPTVQMQVQYHCGHQVQDSESITKHVKATAAGGEVTNMPAHQVLSIKMRELTFRKNLSQKYCSNDIIFSIKKRKSNLIQTLFE